MFKTVRNKLMLSFLLFTFLCVAIAFSYYQYDRYKARLSYTTDILNNTYAAFLNQVKLINDFLDYETKNVAFYKANESQMLILYEGRKESLEGKINLLKTKSNAKFDLDYDLSLLSDKFNDFDSIFTKISKLVKIRGFRDFGLEGQMRENVHKLEDSKKVDMVILLTMRRHEKDFILRSDPDYLDEHKEAAGGMVKFITNSSKLAAKDKDSLMLWLNNYTSLFGRYVEIATKLGLQNNTGLKRDLDSKIAEIQSELVNMIYDAEQIKSKIFTQINIFIIIFISGIIVLSIYLGQLFSRKMTEHLSMLSSNIAQFVESGFTEETVIESSKDDEVGVLIRNYMIMKEETISLINDFKEKVNERTAEINRKQEEILLQKEEIESQRDSLFEKNQEINHQKGIAERHNKSMLDSINYAKKIQESMQPPIAEITKHFADGFVFYQPKDIISGDFYAFNTINTPLGLRKMVAAADCTGHGVPGALMSMMAISLLNEIVNKEKMTDTAEVLNKLRRNVVRSLHKGKPEKLTNDGLDIAICILDLENRKAEFAGANRPLYLVRDQEIHIIKGDKMPIGNFVNQSTPFEKTTFDIQNNDRLYLFTDGYTDQFGGGANRKFMNRRFRDLILQIHKLPMEEQLTIFKDKHLSWKGKNVQLDDILVIGVKIEI